MPCNCWRYKQKIKKFWPLLPLKSVSWCSATEVMTPAFTSTLNSLQKDSLRKGVGFFPFFKNFLSSLVPLQKYSTGFSVPLWFFSMTLTSDYTNISFLFHVFNFFLHIFILIARTIYFCSWKNAKSNLSHRTPKMNSGRKGVVEDLGPGCKLLTGVICHFASRIGAMKVL